MGSIASKVGSVAAESRVARWLWAGLLALTVAGYPLVSGIPILLGVPSRTISVPYRAVVLVAALALLWRGIVTRTVFLGAEWIPLFFFWLLYLLRLLLDCVFFPAPLGLSTTEYFSFAFGLCLFPMLGFFTSADTRTKSLSLRLSLLAAFVASLSAAFVNLAALAAGDVTTTVESGRFSTSTLDPISLGHLGTSLALLCLVVLLSDVPRRAVPRVVAMAGVVIGMATVLASASRGPLLALFVVTAMLVWARFRRSSVMTRVSVLIVIVAIVAGLLTAALALQDFGLVVVTRLAGVTSDQSSAVHASVMADGIREFLRSPLLGNSVDETTTASYPHNVVIESFMATGFFGGLAFSTVLVLGMRAGWQMLCRWNDETWIALIFWQRVIASMLSGSLYLDAGMWTFLAVVVSLNRYHRLGSTVDRNPVLRRREGWQVMRGLTA